MRPNPSVLRAMEGRLVSASRARPPTTDARAGVADELWLA
jgi:hypothetical protein